MLFRRESYEPEPTNYSRGMIEIEFHESGLNYPNRPREPVACVIPGLSARRSRRCRPGVFAGPGDDDEFEREQRGDVVVVRYPAFGPIDPAVILTRAA